MNNDQATKNTPGNTAEMGPMSDFFEHARGHVQGMPGSERFDHDLASDTACLLIHGFTASPQAMRELGKALAETGFANSCPLLPGHGTTVEHLNATEWPTIEQAVEEEFKKLSAKHKRVIVIGESSGGVLALRVAIKRPSEVAGVVSVGGSLRFPAQWASPIVLPLYRLLFGSAPRKVRRADVADQEAVKSRVAYQHIALIAFKKMLPLNRETESQLEKITAPLLVQQSPYDHSVAPKSAQIIYERASSRQKQLLWYRKSHHILLIDHDKREVIRDIIEFVKKVDAGKF